MGCFKFIEKHRCVFNIVTSSSGCVILMSGIFVFLIRDLRSRRLCLLFLILLSDLFTFENAFSGRDWQKSNLVLHYDKNEKSITFDCLIYDYHFSIHKHSFLNWGEFTYSEDGANFNELMTAGVKYYPRIDRIQINLISKKTNEHIQIIDPAFPENAKAWPEGKEILVDANFVNSQSFKGLERISSKTSYMTVKWFLPPACKGVRAIKLKGDWRVDGGKRELFNVVYMLNIVKSKANTINGPSVLQSDIANQVKLTRDADAITVTGAKPGENIKVYTVSGGEVKSVVANEDVVNIKLPTNQTYIVKAGQTFCKFAL